LVESVLDSDPVQRVLAELEALGAAQDEQAKLRVKAREAELGQKLYGAERAELGRDAPWAVKPLVGRLLHALTLVRRPSLSVEFGTSVGVSTLYLASALRDLGAGRLITSELLPDKAARAVENLIRAGLADLVEVRVGDAMQTLARLEAEVDLLFLDGSNDLYLPVLELLRSRLAPHALIVADMSPDDPHHERYRAHVTDAAHGYLTSELPLDAGVVVSVLAPDSS
jgi:predicted O-methyltransferase YrrM